MSAGRADDTVREHQKALTIARTLVRAAWHARLSPVVLAADAGDSAQEHVYRLIDTVSGVFGTADPEDTLRDLLGWSSDVAEAIDNAYFDRWVAFQHGAYIAGFAAGEAAAREGGAR